MPLLDHRITVADAAGLNFDAHVASSRLGDGRSTMSQSPPGWLMCATCMSFWLLSSFTTASRVPLFDQQGHCPIQMLAVALRQ
jgi:hypothetical protein